MTEDIILVDDQDHAIGTLEKMEAHRRGVLHRAFSVIVFNSQRKMLLQKRSESKYHSGGLWTNACCSHPRPNESMQEATRKRLMYEMGIPADPAFAFKFIYQASLDNNLIEHELDYVFIATYDGVPVVNKNEVEAWKFMRLDELQEDLKRYPEKYTVWLRFIIDHPEFSKALGQ
ncbi:MAG: isopentenyl-diphosphate Delta-isomerase [Chryseolinea sp.]